MFMNKLGSLEMFDFGKKMVIDIFRIFEKIALVQVEKLTLEGFPVNNYIYCIEPVTHVPDSYFVGT